MADRFDDAAREMLREARSAVEEMLDSPRPAISYMHAIRRLDAAECRIAEALRTAEKADARPDLRTALEALLDHVERIYAGFPPPSEEWFAVRDNALAALKEPGHG